MGKTDELKRLIIEASKNPSFIHHEWYSKYHLEIVEQLALEMCNIYNQANKELVLAIAWLHDYGKILGLKEFSQYKNNISQLMTKIGFENAFINKTVESIKIFESKMEFDLNKASIEIKIVSSADGAAHMIGPFYSIWFYENGDKPIEDLMAGNLEKARRDWERKIVLPEIHNLFKERYKFVRENNGEIPKKFFN